MINFRYRILEKLGEGGSGQVFLAEDLLHPGQLTAVKVIHPPAEAGGSDDEALRNEVSVLVNLSHPNLVRIFDFGTVRHSLDQSLQGRRFFAMEYLKGADSLAWTQEVAEKGALIESLLLQSLSVVSYIHREGIVHFDIKPQNLVLVGEPGSTANPVLKLTDFGFSKKQDESLEMSLRGTLEYTAPELLRGESHDHRIDLYSLGATFFHLLEGRCPFEASSPVELVKMALNEEAVLSPSATSSPRLREVVTRLLSKDPGQRFQTAEEAARVLLAGAENPQVSLDLYFGFSRKAKFVGRGQEKKQIASAILSMKGDVPDGATRAMVVSGAEGIGKTALLREMAKFTQAHDVAVYEMEALQYDIPFSAIASVLRLLRLDAQAFSNEGRALIDKYAPVLIAGEGAQQAGQLADWGREKEKVSELQSRFIVDCASLFPFVILADNLHLVDEQSMSVLKTAVRDAMHGHLLVLAAETGDHSSLLNSGTSVDVVLAELDPSEISEMSASVFGQTAVTAEIGHSVYELYGGTPAVAVEALRALSDILSPDVLASPDVAREYIAGIEAQLPKNIEDFLLVRYRKLNRERQLILDILSCFKSPVPVTLLVQILPFSERRTREQLHFLKLEGYLGTADNERSVFVRIGKLKSSVYSSIEPNHQELHSLIALAMESFPEEQSFVWLQEIAHQFSAAGDTARASIFSERAADEGLHLFALERSIQLYRDAMDGARSVGDTPRAHEVQGKLANALFHTGSYQEAINVSTELLQLPSIPEIKHGPLYKIIGLAESRLGENDKAKKHIEQVLAGSTDEIERIELSQELVGIDIALGHFKEAEQSCIAQLSRARDLGSDRLVASIHTDLGIATFFQDRFDDAVNFFLESLRTYEKINEKTQVTNAMNNIGNALSAKGDLKQAIEYWESGLRASREFGTLNQQAQIQNNLGIAHYKLKKYGEAKKFYAEALKMYERINSTIGLAYSLSNLGEVSFSEGEYESALQRWKEAKGLYRSMDVSHALVETSLHLAGVYLILGVSAAACDELNEAREEIKKKQLETFLARYHYLDGLRKMSENDYRAATAAFEEAHERFQSEGEAEQRWLCSIRKGEALFRRGMPDSAVSEISAVLDAPEASARPQIVAEANYLLGTIGASVPTSVTEKPIVYFKRGMDAIVKEPVGEVTWKLAFGLAREFYERGQRDRAKEFLLKTDLVLQFFLSHFTSHDLRNQYLAVDNKAKVLATIDALTKQ